MPDGATDNHWHRTAAAYNRWALEHLRPGPIRTVWHDRLSGWVGANAKAVLDVGTGPGIMACYLAELGHQVTAIDQAAGMIAHARENAARLGLAIQFELGDGHRLPFADGTFDVVVNRLVLLQMRDPAQAIGEWCRVIRPGGRLVVIDGDASRVRGTLRHKIWKVASVPFVYATEGRNPLRNRMPMAEWNQLPLVKVARPDWEVREFQARGLRDVRVDIVARRAFGLMEYIKHGCWGNYWAVIGDRPAAH